MKDRSLSVENWKNSKSQGWKKCKLFFQLSFLCYVPCVVSCHQTNVGQIALQSSCPRCYQFKTHLCPGMGYLPHILILPLKIVSLEIEKPLGDLLPCHAYTWAWLSGCNSGRQSLRRSQDPVREAAISSPGSESCASSFGGSPRWDLSVLWDGFLCSGGRLMTACF